MTAMLLPRFFARTGGTACLLFLFCTAAFAEESPREIAEFKARAGSMTAAAISGDGRFVLTGEDDGLVTLWNVATGASAGKFMGHGRTVFAAALLPDGKRAVTCGDDNSVIVWELSTGKRLQKMETGDSTPLVMSSSPDGALAAVGGADGAIGIWDLADGKRLTTLRQRSTVYGVQFSPDGRLMAAGYADGRVILWSTSDWAAQRTIPDSDGASVGALAFSDDGRLLVTGNQNGDAMAWNVADGSRISSFIDPNAPPVVPPNSPVLPGCKVTAPDHGAVAFLHTVGPWTLAAGQNFVPKLWDTRGGKPVAAYPALSDSHFYTARYGYPFATAALSARRDLLVTLKDNLAQVWRISFKPGP